jgi:bacillithiol biosynthesis cysteine-adding enzyme BshC
LDNSKASYDRIQITRSPDHQITRLVNFFESISLGTRPISHVLLPEWKIVASNCIPFSSIPHSTPLFLDFLHHFDKVSRFYPHPPIFTDWWKDEQPRIPNPQDRRAAVAAVLERQNRAFGAGAKALDNIQRLKDGAPAIVTGQQVAMFGGPLFSLLKAISVLLIAKKTGGVPIFWLATEDHDFAEVNFVHLPAADHIETFSAHPPHREDAPVGTIAFDDQISDLFKRAAEQFGSSEFLVTLEQSYRPGETFGSAFGKLYARLFAESGLVLLDPSDVELHRIAQPIFRDSLAKWSQIKSGLAQRQEELESAGYHAQVKVTPSHTLCFYLEDGARIPVRQDPSEHDGFLIGEKRVSPQELIAETETHPERFSANVLLRPVMQDYLLPTLCYVGGPTEVAYFAQVEVVYRNLLGRVTPVLPRISATLVEPRQAKLLDRYQIGIPDTFRGPEKFREYVAGRALPSSIMTSFDSAAAYLEQAIVAIEEPLATLDPTLKDAAQNAAGKMRYQLQSLREKAARAEARKNTEIQRHAHELSTLLYPNKNLQEREIGSAYFLLKYGTGVLGQLEQKLQLGCLDHQVVEIERS